MVKHGNCFFSKTPVVAASGWAALRVVARPAAAMASASAPWLPPISCGHLGDFMAIYTYGLNRDNHESNYFFVI